MHIKIIKTDIDVAQITIQHESWTSLPRSSHSQLSFNFNILSFFFSKMILFLFLWVQAQNPYPAHYSFFFLDHIHHTKLKPNSPKKKIKRQSVELSDTASLSVSHTVITHTHRFDRVYLYGFRVFEFGSLFQLNKNGVDHDAHEPQSSHPPSSRYDLYTLLISFLIATTTVTLKP